MNHKIFTPSFENITPVPNIPDIPFQFSTCNAGDLFHPEFSSICKRINKEPVFHRKLWEWAYIVFHLEKMGVLTEGARGLCFGVGKETLPSYFAKRGATIVATDAPSELGETAGWLQTGEYADSLEALFYPEIIDHSQFEERVSFQTLDMNDIPSNIHGFNFCWSSCCFEHLGSIEKGIEFVINSIEKTLITGGVAVHTTEFNLSSNTKTVENGDTSIYRKRDIEELISRLRQRGHMVEDLKIAPDSFFLDNYVDVPPYTHNPHLKLELLGYVVTSVGIVVRKG